MAGAKKTRMAEQRGMPPVPYDGTVDATHRAAVADRSTQTFVKPGRNSAGQRTSANRSKSGFNLRGVMEVLEEHGFEPTVKVVEALEKLVPLTDKNGAAVLDREGQPIMVPALGVHDSAKIALALMEFAHAKLKSVEMTVKAPELTPEQLDRRLAALLSRHAQRVLD